MAAMARVDAFPILWQQFPVYLMLGRAGTTTCASFGLGQGYFQQGL